MDDIEDSIVLKFSTSNSSIKSIESIVGSMFGSCALSYSSDEYVPIICTVEKKPWHENSNYEALNPTKKK